MYLRLKLFTFRKYFTVSIVELPSEKLKTAKKLKNSNKDMKPRTVELASGTIDLLQNLLSYQDYEMKIFHLMLESPNSEKVFEACIQYEVKFVNPPNINDTLAIEVSQICNLPLEPDERLEIVFHYPMDGKFKAVRLNDCEVTELKVSNDFIPDDCLQNVILDDEQSNSITFKYENLLLISSLKFLTELIKSHGKLLVDIQWRKQVFMTFIKLDIFNYTGIDAASFQVPLYHRNKTIINGFFQKDLIGFPEELKSEKLSKKGKKIKDVQKIEEIKDDSELEPLKIDNKIVTMIVKLKIPAAYAPETSLQELKLELNHHLKFIEKTSLKERDILLCQTNFHKTVKKLAEKVETIIDNSSEKNLENIEHEVKTLLNNDELKEIFKTLIGNTYNMEKKTESNYEFKVRNYFYFRHR